MFACVCVCVTVCVFLFWASPVGRVYFVAGRGKQMAGCVPSCKESNTHTHTKGERETVQAWSVPPITQPLDLPSTPQMALQPHTHTHTHAQIVFYLFLFLCVSVWCFTDVTVTLLVFAQLLSCFSFFVPPQTYISATWKNTAQFIQMRPQRRDAEGVSKQRAPVKKTHTGSSSKKSLTWLNFCHNAMQHHPARRCDGWSNMGKHTFQLD